MTQAEKLEALYKKAKDNGWNDEPWWSGAIVAFDDAGFEASGDWYSCMTILFRHSFARALFGEGMVFIATEDVAKDEVGTFVSSSLVEWQHRLQQAVISKDPIGYLYEAVFGGKDAV